ncbi:MAG: hypothetical protein M5U28_51320 [Sandaracinaceae bacterium]|nr:hypothetical protein [Sandaracinaceae bacterium]
MIDDLLGERDGALVPGADPLRAGDDRLGERQAARRCAGPSEVGSLLVEDSLNTATWSGGLYVGQRAAARKRRACGLSRDEDC